MLTWAAPGGAGAHLQDFGAALATKGAHDQSPPLGGAGLVDSLQPQGPHGLVVVVLPGEHLAVGVVPAKQPARARKWRGGGIVIAADFTR